MSNEIENEILANQERKLHTRRALFLLAAVIVALCAYVWFLPEEEPPSSGEVIQEPSSKYKRPPG